MKVMINLHLEQDPVVADHLTDEQLDRIAAVSKEIKVTVPEAIEDRALEMPDTEVVFGDLNLNMLEKAEKLRWVQAIASGVDDMMVKEFVDSDVTLTSMKGLVGSHLADHAWALLMALSRGIGRAVRERTWASRYSIRDQSWELEGKTLGVVGLGGTGTEVARRAQGFRMEVIAVDSENVSKPDFVHRVQDMGKFYELLENSDVVVNCTPLTDETRGMFNEEAFSRMRDHAFLINVTRGEIVDGPSLMKALENGMIGGAGLDVTPEEPLPDDSPLWDMKNVVITPHTAGGSPLRIERTVELFCENLSRYLEGKPLLGIIDKKKGY